MPVEDEKLRRGIDTVSIPGIFKRRDKLNEILTTDLCQLIGERSEDLIPAMVMPYATALGVQDTIMEHSLISLLGNASGGYPGLDDCKKANYIIAANMDDMRLGTPVAPFVEVNRKEWVPVMLVDQSPTFVVGLRQGGTACVFQSLAGYTATAEFKKNIANGWVYSSVHVKMFGLPKSEYQYMDRMASYVGMVTWALFDPDLEWDVFERAEYTHAVQKGNRELMKARFTPCAYGYDMKCPSCMVGRETCWRGTHRGMWETRRCIKCSSFGVFEVSHPEEKTCKKCKSDAKIAYLKYK